MKRSTQRYAFASAPALCYILFAILKCTLLFQNDFCNKLKGAGSFLMKLILLNYLRDYLHFIEFERSLPRSKSLPLAPVLGQINPSHSFRHLFQINFNTIYYYVYHFTTFLQVFPPKLSIHCFLRACYITCPSRLP